MWRDRLDKLKVVVWGYHHCTNRRMADHSCHHWHGGNWVPYLYEHYYYYYYYYY